MNAMFIKCYAGFKALPHGRFSPIVRWEAADRSYCFCDIAHVAKRQAWSKKIDSVQPRAAGQQSNVPYLTTTLHVAIRPSGVVRVQRYSPEGKSPTP